MAVLGIRKLLYPNFRIPDEQLLSSSRPGTKAAKKKAEKRREQEVSKQQKKSPTQLPPKPKASEAKKKGQSTTFADHMANDLHKLVSYYAAINGLNVSSSSSNNGERGKTCTRWTITVEGSVCTRWTDFLGAEGVDTGISFQ